MIIYISLSIDLPTAAQNRLRYAIELGIWKARNRKAIEENDYAELDRLQLDYERVGLP